MEWIWGEIQEKERDLYKKNEQMEANCGEIR